MNRARHPEQDLGTTYRPDIDSVCAAAVGAEMAFATGRFSFLAFYERRIRSILPNFSALLLIHSAFACFFLLLSEYISFAMTLLATTLSASNFYLCNGKAANVLSLPQHAIGSV